MYVSWSLDRLEDRQSVEQCVYYRLLHCARAALGRGVCMRRAALAVVRDARYEEPTEHRAVYELWLLGTTCPWVLHIK